MERRGVEGKGGRLGERRPIRPKRPGMIKNWRLVFRVGDYLSRVDTKRMSMSEERIQDLSDCDARKIQGRSHFYSEAEMAKNGGRRVDA